MAHGKNWVRTAAACFVTAAALNIPGDEWTIEHGPAGGFRPRADIELGGGGHALGGPSESLAPAGAIRLESRRGFLIAVRGAIGSLDGLTFILDTGSSRTAVDHTVARRLELARITDELGAFGQRTPADRVVLPSVQLGPLRTAPLPAVAIDLHKLGGALGLQPDAVIGLDILLGTCFTVDYRRRTLTFGRTAGWDVSIGLDPRSIDPVVVTNIDGNAYRLLVDTGSDLIIIFERARQANRDIIPDGEVWADHMAGTSLLKRVTAGSVRLGDLELGRLPVYVSAGGEGLAHDGVFGPRWLSSASLQVDLERMVLSWNR